jgi:hypothetical protein
MKRTIVVADLHGAYDEAMDLLEKVNVSSSDRVIFCGDLIDRGPHNDKCVDLAIQWESVEGNHEERHLWYVDHKTPESQMPPTHVATRRQLRPEHYEYFRKLPLYIRLPEVNAVVVHAGVYPGIPIEKQEASHLLHIQAICPPNKRSYWPSKAPEGYKFWTNFYAGAERVIFGHSVLTKPLLTDKICGVDTGAVFGNTLTAVILPEWQIVSVPSRSEGFKSPRGRGREGKPITTYPVMNDVSCYS